MVDAAGLEALSGFARRLSAIVVYGSLCQGNHQRICAWREGCQQSRHLNHLGLLLGFY